MATELGVGYISIVPEVSKITPGIAKALEASEATAAVKGNSLGEKLSGGVGKAFKTGALATGAAAGGLLATSFAKGMGRLTSIENAQAKLSGLGNSAETVSSVMDSALAAVKGTAHGMGEAATTAASMVAAGIKPGKELEQVLKTVGDTATIAGRQMDDVGLIFGSIAARGKLQGDDMLQLMSSGIPVLQLLAEETGKTSAEISDMVSKGQIDFATFERAMREGVGGAALDAGNTFQGATANFGAALGRLGATGLTPFFDLTKQGLGAATSAVDALEGKLKPVAGTVSDFLEGTVIPGVKQAATAVQEFAQSDTGQELFSGARQGIEGLVRAGEALLPVVVDVATTLAQAGGALGVGTWDLFVGALRTVAATLELVAVPLSGITGFLSEHPALVAGAVAAWAGFRYLPDLTSKFATGLDNVQTAALSMTSSFEGVGTGMARLKKYTDESGMSMSRFDMFMQATGDSGEGMAQKLAQSYNNSSASLKQFSQSQRDAGAMALMAATEATNSWDFADRRIAQAGHNVTASVSSMAGTIKGVGAAAFTGLKDSAAGAVDALGGPMAVGLAGAALLLADVQSASASLQQAQDALASATREGALAQSELKAALAGTNGAMGEQELAAAAKIAQASFAELIELGGRDFSVVENLSQATVVVDELAAKVPGLTRGAGKAGSEATRMAKDAREAYEALEQGVSDAGLSMDDLGEIVAKGGPEYQSLVSSLRSFGKAGGRAADELDKARAKIEETVEAATSLDPAAAQAAAGVDVLADASSSAEDKLKALESVMQAMGLAPQAAEEAMAGAAEEIEKIAEAAEKATRSGDEMGTALFDASGKLDTLNNSGARELSASLSTMREELQRVAVSGGDVDAVYGKMQSETLPALAESFGLTIPQMQDLAAQYGLLPDEISTIVNVNSEGVSGELATIWAQLYPLEEGQTIVVDAVGDDAKAVLDQLKIDYEQLDNGQFEITATSDQAQEVLSNVSQMMADLGDTEASPTLFLDTTQMGIGAEQAQAVIDALDIQEPSPQAKLIIDDLIAGKDISVGELNFLAQQTPTPVADLNKAMLDAGVSQSKMSLTELGNQKATPKVTVDNSQANTGIQQVKNWLASIKDRVVNIFTNRQGNAADGLINYAADGRVTGKLSQQNAQIRSGGSWITWAEDETQGESFIPHAPSKRRRSTQILAETARLFGMGLYDQTGRPIDRDGSPVGDKGTSYFADGAVRIKSAEEIKQGVAYMDGTPYLMGGWSKAAVDCSGAVALVVNHMLGKPDFESRMSTVTEGSWLDARGARPGKGSKGDVVIGWYDNGGGAYGHTAMALQDGTSIESGGSTGGGFTIGRGANVNNPMFTNWRHFKDTGVELALGELDSDYDTSVTGAGTTGSTGGGRSVSFGKAQDFFDLAKRYLDAPLFDTGGRWPTGVMGRNQSKSDELVLTNPQWKDLSSIARSVASSGADISQAAKSLNNAAEKQLVSQRHHLGASFITNAEVVMDAEEGLYNLRASISTQADEIAEQEKDLAQARKELAEAEADGGGLTKEQKRKQADAEEDLVKARASGKPDQIASAEKKLARVREDNADALAKSTDKNAEKVRKAQEKVDKAEDSLRETRAEHEEALNSIQAAERAVLAARIQAVGDFAGRVTDALRLSFDSISGMFDQLSRAAGIVEKTRQEVSKLEMQQQTNAMNLLQSTQAYQIAEWDMSRTRVRGLLGIAEAEQALEDARENAQRVGLTSINAMGAAFDRFTETGVFGLEKLSEEAVEATDEVKAAQWGVKIAQVQNALDLLDATKAQGDAAAKVAEATLRQSVAANLLQAQTQALAEQTAQLNGMTANQATGAAKGWQGASKIAGGVGASIGGAATGAALGMAVGGPIGAIVGGAVGLFAGLKDIVEGAQDVKANKAEMEESWDSMSGGQKAGVVLGAVGGTAVSIAGAATGNQKIAGFAGEIGASITEAAIGGVGYGINAAVEASERRKDDAISAVEMDSDRRTLELELENARREVEYLNSRDKLEADLEYAKLQQQIHQTDSQRVKDALAAAAEVEQLRASAEKTGEGQIAELRGVNSGLGALLEATREQTEILSKKEFVDSGSLDRRLRSVSSSDYVNVRL